MVHAVSLLFALCAPAVVGALHHNATHQWKPEPCPVDSLVNPDGCAAQFSGKTDADKCPQIKCGKALGVSFKLICGGACCPTCWAPDHVLAVDRHTSIDDAAVVPAAPQAPGSCG